MMLDAVVSSGGVDSSLAFGGVGGTSSSISRDDSESKMDSFRIVDIRGRGKSVVRVQDVINCRLATAKIPRRVIMSLK